MIMLIENNELSGYFLMSFAICKRRRHPLQNNIQRQPWAKKGQNANEYSLYIEMFRRMGTVTDKRKKSRANVTSDIFCLDLLQVDDEKTGPKIRITALRADLMNVRSM
jgi:hypothetical protein